MDFCIFFFTGVYPSISKASLLKEFPLVPQLKIKKQRVCTVVTFLYLDRHFQPTLLVLPWNDELMHHDENSQSVILTFRASFLLFTSMPVCGYGGVDSLKGCLSIEAWVEKLYPLLLKDLGSTNNRDSLQTLAYLDSFESFASLLQSIWIGLAFPQVCLHTFL